MTSSLPPWSTQSLPRSRRPSLTPDALDRWYLEGGQLCPPERWMPPLLGYRPIAACYLAGIDSSAYPYTSVRIRRRSRRARRRERIATNRLRRVERREKNRVHAESVREGLGRQECER